MPDNYSYNAVPYATRILVENDARTEDGSKSSNGWGWIDRATFVLDVTNTADDGTDTLNVYIQRRLPNGAWDDVVAFDVVDGADGPTVLVADFTGGDLASTVRANADATLSAGSIVNDGILGDTLRVVWKITNTTTDGEFEFSVSIMARG